MDGFDALWAFLVAAGVAFVVTPLTARLARRLGVLNRPRDRTSTTTTCPAWAGWRSWRRLLVAGVIFLPGDRRPAGSCWARWPSRWSARWTTGARAGCRRW